MEFYLHIPFPDPVGDARNGVLPTAVLWRSMDYIHHSSPSGWGEAEGLDLSSELRLMSVSMLWLHFCFL